MTTLRSLGRGWSFPVVVDPGAGGLDYLEGPAKVHQSIRLILDTEPGERVMRPTFGCGLRRYLMKPNTVAVRALIKHDVELALGTWEPRIQLTSVDVTPGDDPSLVEIAIAYTHVRTGSPDNVNYLLPLQ
jgi:phage baseplate assembly protein W